MPWRSAEVSWTPPDAFDEFRLERLLGRGGMGVVYLAHDTSLDRHVAVKFIASSQPEPWVRAYFETEARSDRPPAAPQRRHRVPRRRGRRASVHRLRVRRRPEPRGAAPAGAVAPGPDAGRRAGPGARGGASPGRAPPRPQALQRPRHRGGRGEAARLRPGRALRARSGHSPPSTRIVAGTPRLHGARAAGRRSGDPAK